MYWNFSKGPLKYWNMSLFWYVPRSAKVKDDELALVAKEIAKLCEDL